MRNFFFPKKNTPKGGEDAPNMGGIKLTLPPPIALLMLLFMWSNIAKGQNPPFTNYYDYLTYHQDSVAEDTAEGGTWNEIYRRNRFLEPALFPHGDIHVAHDAVREYLQDWLANPQPVQPLGCQPFVPDWANIGSGTAWQLPQVGVGRIHSVVLHPNYPSTNIIFACSSSGGLWRSENGGGWVNLTDRQIPWSSVSDLVISQTNPQNMMLITGPKDDEFDPLWETLRNAQNPFPSIGAFKSNDGGNTWSDMSIGLFAPSYANFGFTMRKIIRNPYDDNVLLVATSDGIFRCPDAWDLDPNISNDWVKIFDGNINFSGPDNQFRGLAYDPDGSNIIYASGKKVYRSIDNGTTWSELPVFSNLENNLILYPVKRINIAVSGTSIYAYAVGTTAIVTNGVPVVLPTENYGFFKMPKNGLAWSTIDYGPQDLPSVARLDIALFRELDPANTPPVDIDHVITGHTIVKYATFDNNQNTQSFTDLSPFHLDIHGLTWVSKNIFYFACDGGVGRFNKNVNWSNVRINQGLQVATIWSFDDSGFYPGWLGTAEQDNATKGKFWDDNIDWRRIQNNVNDGYGMRIAGDYWIYDNGDFINGQGVHPWQLSFRKYDPTIGWPTTPLTPQAVTTIPDFPPNAYCDPLKPALANTFPLKHHPYTNEPILGATELLPIINIESNIYGPELSNLNSINTACPSFRQLTEFEIAESDGQSTWIATMGRYSNGGNLENSDYVPRLFHGQLGGNFSLMTRINNNNFPEITIQGPNGPVGVTPVITGIAIDPRDANRVWISFSGYHEDYRVWRTEDGGATWEDYDPNDILPRLPVNAIVYQNGTDDRIFIGTDAGVYVKEGADGDWCEYGEFPHVRVTEMKINYCASVLRVATYGRGVWEGTLPPMEEYNSALQINTDMTWSGIRNVKQDIRIKAGKILTLDNTCILNMPENARIIVEPNAQLIVDGGKITNNCGKMWNGIYIEGDQNLPQVIINGIRYQGYVYMNGATVEHAMNSVSMQNVTEDPNDFLPSGGVIIAENTQFLNNYRSTEFLKYENFNPVTLQIENNLSHFDNCFFNIDDDFRKKNFYAHNSLWMVRGVKYNACHFLYNNSVLDEPEADRCFGIHAQDAHFIVQGYCNVNVPFGTPCPANSYDRGSFYGLRYGIQSESVYGTRPYEVYDQDFGGCLISIRSEAVDEPVIVGNTFEVGANPWSIDPNNAASTNEGLRINGRSTGYWVQGNTFSVSPNPVAFSIGAGIRDVGGSDNVIEGNNFNGLYVASLSNGVNWNQTQPFQGHKWLCNIYDENWGYDIAGVNTYNDPSIDEGIHPEQEASPANSAGNQFLFDNQIPESNFFNNANAGIRYRPFQSLPSVGTPINRSNSVILSSVADPNCPDIEDPKEKMSEANKTSLLNALSEEENELEGLIEIHEQLIDGGSTAQTVSNIETDWNTIQELREGLLEKSPYLSQEAILEAMEKDILPLAIQMEVLLANPDVLGDKGFLNQLADEIPSPIPAYLIEVLKSASTGETARTILENAISGKAWEIDAAVNRLIKDNRKDTIPSDSNLRALYTRLQGIEGKYLLAEQWLSEGNLTEAQNALQDLPTEYKLKGKNLEAHERFIQWFNLIGALKISSRSILQLTATEKTTIEQIAAADDGFASVKARNLLRFVYGQAHDKPMVLPEQAPQQRIAQRPTPSVKNTIKVFPNPAGTYVVLENLTGEFPENAVLHITDALGRGKLEQVLPEKQKQWVWNCGEEQNGLYLYHIEVGGVVTASGKITIHKP